ncbi:hypothetical protein [Desulfonema magnum]|uniref:Uncharacterized protein n=1 Tax=Desulfonema magnum TaxID=45655 RepID=A0A975GN19_9BACT|nr:hypothetical protein [Desulfonema magnum]QTA87299.1 Uncharacterized protein dnm_033290 [Desulfonema magnum]
MMNFKQKQLTEEFFQVLKIKFPEVELIDITPSPEDPDDLWLNITAPPEEEREFELMDMASERTADILQEYGYSILVMPTRNQVFHA